MSTKWRGHSGPDLWHVVWSIESEVSLSYFHLANASVYLSPDQNSRLFFCMTVLPSTDSYQLAKWINSHVGRSRLLPLAGADCCWAAWPDCCTRTCTASAIRKKIFISSNQWCFTLVVISIKIKCVSSLKIEWDVTLSIIQFWMFDCFFLNGLVQSLIRITISILWWIALTCAG